MTAMMIRWVIIAPWGDMEMRLTGELIDARQAHAYGLINRVAPPNEVVAVAECDAARIAYNGPLAAAAVKQAVLENAGREVKTALAREMDLAMPVFRSRDAQEGPRVFKEKRDPVCVGESGLPVPRNHPCDPSDDRTGQWL